VNITFQQGKQKKLLYDKEFCFFLIGLNSIFSTLPKSEYTLRAVSAPRVRYFRACPPTNQSQDAKKVKIFKFKISKNFKISKFKKNSKS
jgi:hypothetical protein